MLPVKSHILSVWQLVCYSISVCVVFACFYLPIYLIFSYQGSRPKKLTFLADMSAKAFSPPPQSLNGHIPKNVSFFSCIQILVFPPQKITLLVDKRVFGSAQNRVFLQRLPLLSVYKTFMLFKMTLTHFPLEDDRPCQINKFFL